MIEHSLFHVSREIDRTKITNRDFIDGAWFKRAFGRRYDDEWDFGNRLYRLFSMHGDDDDEIIIDDD
jgi:hypothetical protein